MKVKTQKTKDMENTSLNKFSWKKYFELSKSLSPLPTNFQTKTVLVWVSTISKAKWLYCYLHSVGLYTLVFLMFS